MIFQSTKSHVWPICIPSESNENRNHLEKSTTQVLGYGPDPENDDKQVLTVMDMTIHSTELCNKKHTVRTNDSNYPTIKAYLPKRFDGGSVFCASKYGPKEGTCKGDR
jgi:hypothetical protein